MNNIKGKRTGDEPKLTVTFTDVIIIIAAVLVVLFAVRYVFSDGESDESYAMSYVVKISEVRDELVEKLGAGDVLYMSPSGVEIGTVAACETTVAVRDKTGQTVPGRSDIYVTVEVKSSEPDRILVSGCEITVEGKYSMRSTDFSFECVCVSVDQ